MRVFVVKSLTSLTSFPATFYRKDYPAIHQFEIEHRTNTFEALYAFNSRVQLLRASIGGIVDHLVERHGPLWGFGASTKGNMILQSLGVTTDRVSCILDNGLKKIGTRTTGSLIPIVDEGSYLAASPEYLFVLPYYYTRAFADIIRKRLRPGDHVHLFVPLPHPHFVTVKRVP